MWLPLKSMFYEVQSPHPHIVERGGHVNGYNTFSVWIVSANWLKNRKGHPIDSYCENVALDGTPCVFFYAFLHPRLFWNLTINYQIIRFCHWFELQLLGGCMRSGHPNMFRPTFCILKAKNFRTWILKERHKIHIHVYKYENI